MFTNGCLKLSANHLIFYMVVVSKCSIVFASISSQTPIFILFNSSVKVQDLQTYRNMQMTRKRISFFSLYLRQKLQTFWSFSHYSASALLPWSPCECYLRFSALISILYLMQVLSSLSPRLLVPSLPQQEHLCYWKLQTGHNSATYPNLFIMFFYTHGQIWSVSEKMLLRVGDSRHPCLSPTVVLNHSPMIPFIWTALVVKLLSDANLVYFDIVLPHGGP